MTGADLFECPSCGSSLTAGAGQTQVVCPYCGRIVIVPEALRIPAPSSVQPAPGAPPRVPEVPQAVARGRTRKRGGGCGTFLVIALVLLVGSVLGLLPTRSARKIASVAALAPTPVPTAFHVSLGSTLPRTARYASLDFNITGATISNEMPTRSDEKPRISPKQAYAYVDASVRNALGDKDVYLSEGQVQLQTADGKLYPEAEGWSDVFNRTSTKDERLVFQVPLNASWQGAKLVFGTGNKEQTALPLDGPAPTPQYPMALSATAQATANEMRYEILSSALDVDLDGERAVQGKRYLILDMRMTNLSSFAGGAAIGPNEFRLLVDGNPLAPVKAPIEFMAANSALDGQVAFLIPATAKQAELQVGETGKPGIAKIQLKLQR